MCVGLQLGGSTGERVTVPPLPSPVNTFDLTVRGISNLTRSSGVSLLTMLPLQFLNTTCCLYSVICPLGKGHSGLEQSEQQPEVQRDSGGLFLRHVGL